MKHTSCRQRDCLNFWATRVRPDDGENEIFCLADIPSPDSNCHRYAPPSWKPCQRRHVNKKQESR